MSIFGTDGFMMGSEMPHEAMMDKYNIEFSDLSEELQNLIREFDKAYVSALSDGIFTNEEYLTLYKSSLELTTLILKENPEK